MTPVTNWRDGGIVVSVPGGAYQPLELHRQREHARFGMEVAMKIEVFLHARPNSIRAKLKVSLRRVLPTSIAILLCVMPAAMDGSHEHVTGMSAPKGQSSQVDAA